MCFSSNLVIRRIYNIISCLYVKYKYDVILGKNVSLNFGSVFEGKNAILNHTEFTSSFLGYYSYIGNYSVISYSSIGKFCAIGDYVRTCIGIHPSSKFVSIHPAFYSSRKQSGYSFCKKNRFEEHNYIDKEKNIVVNIGNDVWIGNNVSIFDGVNIGHGAIVGLGSIVTKDIEPFSINVGIPAQKIGYRFNSEQIDFLLDFCWWNNDDCWLNDNAHLFNDIKKLMELYG